VQYSKNCFISIKKLDNDMFTVKANVALTGTLFESEVTVYESANPGIISTLVDRVFPQYDGYITRTNHLGVSNGRYLEQLI
jgi:hypothetical protein